MYQELYDRLSAFAARLAGTNIDRDLWNEFASIMRDIERLRLDEADAELRAKAVRERFEKFCEDVRLNKQYQPEYFI